MFLHYKRVSILVGGAHFQPQLRHRLRQPRPPACGGGSACCGRLARPMCGRLGLLRFIGLRLARRLRRPVKLPLPPVLFQLPHARILPYAPQRLTDLDEFCRLKESPIECGFRRSRLMGPKRRRRILTGVFLLVILALQAHLSALARAQGAPLTTPATRQNYAGDEACRACHAEKAAGYKTTAHHFTSQPPTKESILGSFAEAKNILKTSDPNLYFQMDSKPDGFYQTSVLASSPSASSHTERIDVVIGSGRRGQTYLYWKGDQLFQLPVSYWTDLSTWI